jgi:spore germination protein GerM
MNRLVAVALLAGSAAGLAAGCGVGGDGDLQRIGAGDLAGLDQTTTSTTTSTTTTTTTTVPPTASVVAGSTSTAATTTTIPTEPVELYFIAGDVLESVTQELTRGPGPSRVLEVLESGPPTGDAGIGLTSLVPPGLTRPVIESGTGVATVDLVGELFESIEGGIDQRRAIAQIVLTLTRRPGIGQVRFTLDGEDLAVPKLGNVLSDPGEAVARIDYESLLEQGDLIPAPATTTPETTSTPPPTTETTETTTPTTETT